MSNNSRSKQQIFKKLLAEAGIKVNIKDMRKITKTTVEQVFFGRDCTYYIYTLNMLNDVQYRFSRYRDNVGLWHWRYEEGDII